MQHIFLCKTCNKTVNTLWWFIKDKHDTMGRLFPYLYSKGSIFEENLIKKALFKMLYVLGAFSEWNFGIPLIRDSRDRSEISEFLTIDFWRRMFELYQIIDFLMGSSQCAWLYYFLSYVISDVKDVFFFSKIVAEERPTFCNYYF